MNQLRKIKTLSWSEVFEIWRSNEEGRENWKELILRRGFPSWEAWRMTYANEFELPNLNWELFKIENPSEVVGSFYGGPFRGLIKNVYGKEDTMRFSQMAKLEKIQNNAAINEIADKFPDNTVITALKLADKIFIIEGMHRCCALAIMKEQGMNYKGNVFIALSQYPKTKLLIVGMSD
jgi:hypothetical protein